MQLFNEDHHQFWETVRKFVAGEITPHGAEWEKNGAIPKDLWRKMGELGFLCVQLHGGYGYMQEYPIRRAYANVRLHTIAGGTTEIMKEVIASKIGLRSNIGNERYLYENP
ncbi:MAG: hypothetical protein B6I30_07405 [Desulfobacteraceae bacterium 4572_187]|nr:MAG: hypothetical protein B6I30_07405 [Desulfobacteraceae bacterium 4572_187]